MLPLVLLMIVHVRKMSAAAVEAAVVGTSVQTVARLSSLQIGRAVVHVVKVRKKTRNIAYPMKAEHGREDVHAANLVRMGGATVNVVVRDARMISRKRQPGINVLLNEMTQYHTNEWHLRNAMATLRKVSHMDDGRK